MLESTDVPAPWPVGDGEMAQRIRELDWGATPLGHAAGWPQCLRTAVDLMVANGFGMIVLWGPHLIQIYNDGYRDVMGEKHPRGLGQATRDCWPEVWDINEPIYRRIWAGETLTFEDARYPLERRDKVEDVWLTLTYSPLRDDVGAVAGVLVTLFETTERIRGEALARRLLEGLAQATWETDPRGVVIGDSASWRRYTGQSHDEWVGYGWLDAIHPEDRAYAERQWREAVAAERDVNAEFRLRRASGTYCWTNVRATPLRDAQGRIVKWIGMNIDIDARREAEARQAILLSELQHRTRNMLAVVRGIASRTSENSDDLEMFLAHFQGRLAAMARTQAATSRSPDVSVGLAEMLHDEFLAVAAQEEQVDIRGPEVRLKGKVAETLSLGLHELATNALKYGALSSPRGHVSVRWELKGRGANRSLLLRWKESHVPMLDLSPQRIGFGRRLIEIALPYELGAQTKLSFAPGGVSADIQIPLGPQAWVEIMRT